MTSLGGDSVLLYNTAFSPPGDPAGPSAWAKSGRGWLAGLGIGHGGRFTKDTGAAPLFTRWLRKTLDSVTKTPSAQFLFSETMAAPLAPFEQTLGTRIAQLEERETVMDKKQVDLEVAGSIPARGIVVLFLLLFLMARIFETQAWAE
ncbi:hypothetical protein PGTUg99_029084 [Puccinia graminis f. sp. tritici]|uniref:Uncharacterized protein n=1 Tax=Puccinia graminis f. sp. tritici TaxID=56615 RepID=A0A5B0PQV6_PUCGR|nr:hypothetical protein PGTUg99_029084 [Puccinia graminis f. sp. tritici]